LSFDLTRVSTDKELDDALAKGSWDAILCDYMLPELSAHQALEVVRKRKLDIPFIIVSGTISDETAVDMMRAGAHDYLIKSNLSRLIPALKREILEAENRQKRRFAEANLRESELKHRLLVKSLSDTVLVITSDGVVSEFY
jgi:two-component system cell cycle sensor histidine kinase/response regulator CckA